MDGINGPPVTSKEPDDFSAADLPPAISVSQTGIVEGVPMVDTLSPKAQAADQPSRHRPIGIALIILGLLTTGVLVALHAAAPAPVSYQNVAQQYTPQSASTAGEQALVTASSAGTLTVNGQLAVTNHLLLTPGAKPTTPTVGEIYYDQSKSALGYYNGGAFVYLQGGGAANVTNTTNNTYNTTDTHDTTVNNLTSDVAGNTYVTNTTTGSSLDASGAAAGDVAMFTGADALGPSLITQSGTTISTGAGVESVDLGSTAGASSTTLQGGTGGLTLQTGTASGISGGVTIQSGASSTTASGNVTVDTGSAFVTGTVISDYTFEDGTDGLVPWSGPPTVTQDCTVAHSGSCSLAINGPVFWGIIDDNFTLVPVTAGHHYYVSAWVKGATASAKITGRVIWNVGTFDTNFLLLPTITTTTTGWTQMTATGVAPAGATLGNIVFGSGDGSSTNGVQYLDDVSVTDLSSSSTAAVLNLGASNAQVISIGNMDEIGPTTITGGSGINLAAGVSSINVGGGAIAIAGSGASSLATTNGSLSLGSGGGVDGGVTVRPATDSTTAFQVQNASAQSLLNIDSTNNITTDTGNVIVKSAIGCSYNKYVADVLALSPTGYWQLNDAGTTAGDTSGNGDTGTLTSGITTGITPGPFSCTTTVPAMSFPGGVTDQITTATSMVAPQAYSQVAMFKTSTVNDIILGFTDGGGNDDRNIYVGSDGKLYASFFNNSLGTQSINTPFTVDDGNWHMVAVSESAAGLYLYFDGQLVASNTSFTAPQSYTGHWEIGRTVNADTFNGDIAQVSVSGALTEPQVQQLAAAAGMYNFSTAAVGIGTATPGANLEDAGSALFDAPTDTTNAFQIQNSAGSDILDVDTTNQRIGIGTSAPTQTLEVAGGNVQVDAGGITLSGIQPPTTSPTLTATGSGVLTGTYYYYVTYVTAAGGETNSGVQSAAVSPAGQSVQLTNIPIGPSGVTARRLYRTTADPSWPDNGYLLATLPNNTATTYLDNTPDSSLGGIMPSLNTASYITNPQGWSGSESFGYGATATSTYATAIGNSASAYYQSVSVGADAYAPSAGNVAVGDQATADFNSVAIGQASLAGNHAVAIGIGSNGGNDSIAIGQDATATAQNQLVVGGSTASGAYIQDAYFGSGVTDTSPQNVTIHATGGSGSNVAGANLNLAGGAGTGNAAGGAINFQVALPGASGSSANATTTVASLSGVNGSALFRNDADSAAAFQIADALGTDALVASTNNLQTGWSAAGATLDIAEDSTTGRSINAAGTINAQGADYAEYFAQEQPGKLALGQLVCLAADSKALPCSDPSQPLIGAVSTNPGYVGNDIYDPKHPDNTALVGLLGQIPVQVSTAGGPIQPGDPLVISTTPGVAQKATSSGQIIGTALAAFNGPGLGEIEVYVHVGYYNLPASQSMQPQASTDLQNNPNAQSNLNDTVANLTVTGTATIANLTVTNTLTTQTLTVNGHIITGGNTPAIASASAACTDPKITVSGNDASGTISITTGAACTESGSLATTTFASPYTATPRVTLTPGNAAALALGAYVDDTATSKQSFTLGTNTTPRSATTYVWNYLITQ